MPNVGQLICAWNSFAINTVELKQRTTKRKTKTERNATELRIRFNESKRDQTFASYHTVDSAHIGRIKEAPFLLLLFLNK